MAASAAVVRQAKARTIRGEWEAGRPLQRVWMLEEPHGVLCALLSHFWNSIQGRRQQVIRVKRETDTATVVRNLSGTDLTMEVFVSRL